MEKYIEQNGITYELRGEQYYPLLELPEQKEVGKYGRLHLEYLKAHRKGYHTTLLTQREFDLLYKLLSYPKKTFTRTQLMDEFWDVDTQTSTRTVDVYMTKLRAKLSDCDSFEIQTVHGLGYKAVIK